MLTATVTLQKTFNCNIAKNTAKHCTDNFFSFRLSDRYGIVGELKW